MIRFERVPKPEGFSDRVETRGAQWLAAHGASAGRPPDYWSEFRIHLADGFRSLCGYSAMHEPVGTVDHFVSVNEDPARAYDWTNYRFASAWINASKSRLRHDEVLDPYEVEDGWFEILLPSLQLVATDRVPPGERDRVHSMLGRLHLGHDERVIRQRREWLRMHETGELTLDGLARKAPLIAAAVRKRDGIA